MARDIIPQAQGVYSVDFANLQQVSFTGTSAASTNAIPANSVLLYATQDCYVVFGTSPTATTSGFFVAKGQYISVAIPSASKVAAIQDSAAGKLFVVPLNTD